MVKLRLMRGGRKKRPFYRIVAAHSAFKRDGRFLEKVGTYDPLAADGNQITLKEDRIIYWLTKGAQTTDTTHNIFSQAGIMLKFDMMKRNISEEEIEKAVSEHVANTAKKISEKAAKAAKKKEDAAKAAEKAAKEAAKAEEEAATEEAPAEEAAAEAAPAEEAAAEAAPAEEAAAEEAPAEEEKKEEA